ncbi:MAG: NrfD/PsrC family molybdoenzyme membrane anchor subunit [Candidatus Limnocylindria bacterium]|nr:NrfD/PsrC family molybdoenzyme membrane anchor subunit [Candidatus Limnocylindria bacterium]
MDARTHELYVDRAMRNIGRTGPLWWAIVAVLALCVAGAFYAWVYQLQRGLGVTGLNQKVSWGFYIINCVFFIGISYGGAMTSAILRLTNAKWRAPITRLAEGTAVVALLVGAVYPLVDLGRPDRFLYLLQYGQVGSPVLWDFVAISTYLIASIVFLYLPLIPDLATCRDKYEGTARGLRGWTYRVFALGWTGEPKQERALLRGMGVMAVLIIPLAISVHSVLAWLFAVTVRGGWHSTIFAPLFVLAAMLSGVAAVILVIAGFRRAYRLEQFITPRHFRYLSYLLIALGSGYVYFMVSEYLTEGYVLEAASGPVLEALFVGAYAAPFWGFVLGGLLLPLVLVALPGRYPVARACVASVLIIGGMWLKRFLIVVPGMAEPLMPWDWGLYQPTWVEIAITVGSAAAIPLGLMIFFFFFPVMSVHELEEVEGATEPARPALASAFAGGGDD